MTFPLIRPSGWAQNSPLTAAEMQTIDESIHQAFDLTVTGSNTVNSDNTFSGDNIFSGTNTFSGTNGFANTTSMTDAQVSGDLYVTDYPLIVNKEDTIKAYAQSDLVLYQAPADKYSIINQNDGPYYAAPSYGMTGPEISYFSFWLTINKAIMLRGANLATIGLYFKPQSGDPPTDDSTTVAAQIYKVQNLSTNQTPTALCSTVQYYGAYSYWTGAIRGFTMTLIDNPTFTLIDDSNYILEIRVPPRGTNLRSIYFYGATFNYSSVNNIGGQ
jgi:hypothetical protein